MLIMADSRSALRDEIKQKRPFQAGGAEVAVGILRTAAVLERHYNQIVIKRGITIQQYNVLRILGGAGVEGMPTLVIRDRMIHEAPGITRLLDRLEKSGLAGRGGPAGGTRPEARGRHRGGRQVSARRRRRGGREGRARGRSLQPGGQSSSHL